MLLLAPLVLFVLTLPLVVGLAELGWPLMGIVLVLFVYGAIFAVVSLSAAVVLYVDSRALRRRGAEWEPVTWHYLLGGALAVGVVLAPMLVGNLATLTSVPPLVASSFVADVVGMVFSWVVMAVFLSPVVAGPVYVWRRRRRVGRF